MQLARKSLAHGTPLRRRATHAPAPAKPAAIPSPPTVAALNPLPPRWSSPRSTVPSGTAVSGVDESLDRVDVVVELFAAPTTVVLDDEVVVDASALLVVVVAAMVVVPAAPGCAGRVVAVAGCAGFCAGGSFVPPPGAGGTTAAVVGGGAAGVGGGTVAVVVVGGLAAPPHSEPLIGFGGWPGIGAGGVKRGGGTSTETLSSANDHPSIEPGGGLLPAAPTLL